MRSSFTKLGAALAALAVLAVGGSTLASASGSNSPPKATPPVVSGSDSDKNTDSIQDQSGESAESETAETPGNDGPGGHADEPGDPNADTQQEGQN
jgi:hypothetical protein